MNMYCYNCCHGNVVKGFWALWDNIYGYMCSLLYIFPVILDGKFVSFLLFTTVVS